jgi:transcriptional regulator with XRE-family HTH domain
MGSRKFKELLDAIPAERREKIEGRVRETIAAMPLDELRRARQLTQTKLAETLGVNQGEVSKIEHRTDLYLSTLSEYVEALGGSLEIRAVFPDSEVLITQFESLP